MPDKAIIAFRIPDDQREQIRQIADRESETRSTIIRRLVRLGLLEDGRRAVAASGGEAGP